MRKKPWSRISTASHGLPQHQLKEMQGSDWREMVIFTLIRLRLHCEHPSLVLLCVFLVPVVRMVLRCPCPQQTQGIQRQSEEDPWYYRLDSVMAIMVRNKEGKQVRQRPNRRESNIRSSTLPPRRWRKTYTEAERLGLTSWR